MAKRDAKGRVIAGTGSLNPTGRPKTLGEVTDLARTHTKDAITALASVLKKGKSEPARIAAAEALLTRGWGKAQALADIDAQLAFLTAENVRLRAELEKTGATERSLVGMGVAQLLEIVKAGDDGRATDGKPDEH